MPWKLNGRLASSTDNVSLGECRVDIFFQLPRAVAPGDLGRAVAAGLVRRERTDAAVATIDLGTVPLRERATAYTDATGGFVVELPDKRELADKTLEYTVSAPSGSTVAEGSFNADR